MQKVSTMTKCQYYKLYQMLALDSVLFVEEKRGKLNSFSINFVVCAELFIKIVLACMY